MCGRLALAKKQSGRVSDRMNEAYDYLQLKIRARQALQGNMAVAVSSGVVYSLIYLAVVNLLGAGSDSLSALWVRLSTIAVSLLSGVFLSGFAYQNLRIVYGDRAKVSDMFHGFSEEPNKAILIQVVFTVYSLLCSIPLAVYEMTSGESYDMMVGFGLSMLSSALSFLVTLPLSQVFYLLQDFPRRSVKELFSASVRLMQGQKLRLFLLTLSFLPLFLLSGFLMFIPLFWLMPYYRATRAAFYKDLVGREDGHS